MHLFYASTKNSATFQLTEMPRRSQGVVARNFPKIFDDFVCNAIWETTALPGQNPAWVDLEAVVQHHKKVRIWVDAATLPVIRAAAIDPEQPVKRRLRAAALLVVAERHSRRLQPKANLHLNLSPSQPPMVLQWKPPSIRLQPPKEHTPGINPHKVLVHHTKDNGSLECPTKMDYHGALTRQQCFDRILEILGFAKGAPRWLSLSPDPKVKPLLPPE
jgi:hypothetical protein